MLSKSSKTHQAFFASTANEVTGNINKRYTSVSEYFSLKKINKQLNDENAALRNLLKANFEIADSSILYRKDSLLKDTLNRFRKYTYLPAKVVGNTISSNANFIEIERGSLQGVEKGMSVVSPQGVVGIVVEVSDNYCRAMSLLHRNMRISAMLKKNNSMGDIAWNGANPHTVAMHNVSKAANVKIGDTVVTSSYSSNFPSHIMIGTVVKIQPDKTTSFNNLLVKTATDFFSIQYVYIIKNTFYNEQEKLKNQPKSNE